MRLPLPTNRRLKTEAEQTCSASQPTAASCQKQTFRTQSRLMHGLLHSGLTALGSACFRTRGKSGFAHYLLRDPLSDCPF
jgi:hypothetical protein